MRFSLKLFVLVGVFVGLRDVWGVDDAAGFYVNNEAKNNKDLINAVNEKRVIKAVYETPLDYGWACIMDEKFRYKVNFMLLYTDQNGAREEKINEPSFWGGDISCYMKKNVKYTVYFIFKEGLLNSTVSMFDGCGNLIHADFRFFNTTNVTNMSHMFFRCTSLTELDLSEFDTTSVTNMSFMFAGCTALKDLDLSSFNTKSVTDMHYMFYVCIVLPKLDLSKFNTTSVTNMSCMFSCCRDLTELNLSNFDFSSVNNMEDIFCGCKFDNLYLPKKHAKTRRRCICCGDIVDRYVYINGKRFDVLDPKNGKLVGA